MKKILLAIISVIASVSMSAQTIKVYKGDVLVKEYSASEADNVVFAESSTPTPTSHEYVDLGLPSGTLWATCNVGASKPEEYGLYFAWGETTGYHSWEAHLFDWANYKWCKGSSSTITKYCTSSGYGTVDNKTELESADDAATAHWGSNWQMPSREQITELINSSNTTIEWTDLNGVYGNLITSKTNGNTIFLPNTSYRSILDVDNGITYSSYWSRTLYSSNSNDAYDLGIGITFDLSRCNGYSVRPVRVQK